jgi:hypothetical protein
MCERNKHEIGSPIASHTAGQALLAKHQLMHKRVEGWLNGKTSCGSVANTWTGEQMLPYWMLSTLERNGCVQHYILITCGQQTPTQNKF